MNLNKILILEEESIIALDVRYILLRAGPYFPVIIKNKNEIVSSIVNEGPELIIISSDIFDDVSYERIKEFKTKFLLLSTAVPSDYIASPDSEIEVISKPFSNEVLVGKVEHLLKGSPEHFACSVN